MRQNVILWIHNCRFHFCFLEVVDLFPRSVVRQVFCFENTTRLVVECGEMKNIVLLLLITAWKCREKSSLLFLYSFGLSHWYLEMFLGVQQWKSRLPLGMYFFCQACQEWCIGQIGLAVTVCYSLQTAPSARRITTYYAHVDVLYRAFHVFGRCPTRQYLVPRSPFSQCSFHYTRFKQRNVTECVRYASQKSKEIFKTRTRC